MSLLEEHDFGTVGWNNIATTNVQRVNLHLNGPLIADENLGDSAIVDKAVNSSGSLVDSTTGTGGTLTLNDGTAAYSQTITNNNNKEILDQVNNLETDVDDLRIKLNELLGKLRKTGGNGVLND